MQSSGQLQHNHQQLLRAALPSLLALAALVVPEDMHHLGSYNNYRDPSVLTAATVTLLALLLLGQVVAVSPRSHKPFHFKEVQVGRCGYLVPYPPAVGRRSEDRELGYTYNYIVMPEGDTLYGREIPIVKMLKRQMRNFQEGSNATVTLVFYSTQAVYVRWFRLAPKLNMRLAEVPNMLPIEGDRDYKISFLTSGEVTATTLCLPSFKAVFPRDFETILTTVDGTLSYHIRTVIPSPTSYQLDDVDSPEWLAVPSPTWSFRNHHSLKVHCKVFVPNENPQVTNELTMYRAVLASPGQDSSSGSKSQSTSSSLSNRNRGTGATHSYRSSSTGSYHNNGYSNGRSSSSYRSSSSNSRRKSSSGGTQSTPDQGPTTTKFDFQSVVGIHKQTQNYAEENGASIMQGMRTPLRPFGHVIYELRLRTQNASHEFEGVYQCALEREWDRLYVSAVITLFGNQSPFPAIPRADLVSCESLNFDRKKKVIIFNRGQETCIRCRGIGFPQPQVAIYREERELTNNDTWDVGVTKYINVRDAGISEATYIFWKPHPRHAGKYSCRAYNDRGSTSVYFAIFI